MKRRAKLLFALFLLIIFVVWFGLMPNLAKAQSQTGKTQALTATQAVQATKPFQITDDRGVVVRFNKSPQRIVSMLPSLTESVCALGQCARLVGVDRYSNWPKTLSNLPQLGGGLDPNIEAIVALKPDVVLVASSTRATTQLESLGIKVVALEPKVHADMQRVLITLGQLLDIPLAAGAQRVWGEIDLAMTAAEKSIPTHAKGSLVYFEVNSAPYAAGQESFIGETLTRLGAKNIIPRGLGPFPKINPEFVVRANPEVIMVSQQGVAAMGQRPGWAAIRAIREKHVCMFSSDEDDILVRAGPRMAQAAQLMADCLKDKSV
jgi:iron complex transport system substrate-binding protein